MERNNQIELVPTFSLTPNKLSIYNTIVRPANSSFDVGFSSNKSAAMKLLDNFLSGGSSTISRFHNFEISESGRKNILQKINWLYFLAKPKSVTTLNGAFIPNFKMNFLTLTLSGTQKHPTAEITNICFNQFMTEIREKYKLENFVWRLEFQKNGNVHYHIVTDCFIDYHIAQKIWNRWQNKLGYVNEYQKKHLALSLNEYISLYSGNGKTPFETLKKRYFLGKNHNWSTPNSVDVKSVSSGKKISFYISKYFGKKNKSGCQKNDLDNAENSQGLRLWFCSRSLSKLKKITDFIPAFHIDLLSIVTSVDDTFVAIHDYCTTYFYNFVSLCGEFKGVLFKLLKTYSVEMGYCPHTG